MQWRINAEEVAFQDGSAREEDVVGGWLRAAVRNTTRAIVRRAGLNGVRFGFGYYSCALMYITAAVAVANGMDGLEAGDPGRAEWIAQFLAILLSFLHGVRVRCAPLHGPWGAEWARASPGGSRDHKAPESIELPGCGWFLLSAGCHGRAKGPMPSEPRWHCRTPAAGLLGARAGHPTHLTPRCLRDRRAIAGPRPSSARRAACRHHVRRGCTGKRRMRPGQASVGRN